MKRPLKRLPVSGFTIVEMLIVIVIIAILAAIVLIAYNNVQGQAYNKSVLSDVDNIDGLETDYGLKNNVAGEAWYSGSGIDANLNFTPSAGNVIDVVLNSTDYCIRGYNLKASTYNKISNAATKESTPGTFTVGSSNYIAPSSAAIAGSP
jgi:prepilin-type N-terminal cleavage/methylation domain-containing protein